MSNILLSAVARKIQNTSNAISDFTIDEAEAEIVFKVQGIDAAREMKRDPLPGTFVVSIKPARTGVADTYRVAVGYDIEYLKTNFS